MTSVAVVVPYRDRGDPDRAANLVVVRQRLEVTGWPVIVADDGRSGGPFCRSAAYNRGVAEAGRVGCFCFVEADMLVPPSSLRLAVDMATAAPGLVVPMTSYHYLSPEGSAAVRAGVDPATIKPLRTMYGGSAVGAVNVVSAQTMRAVGRWDEQMAGWGYDDRAMVRAFAVCTRRLTRYVEGPAYHLFHTPGWPAGRFAGGAAHVSAEERAATDRNRARLRAYLGARTAGQIRLLTGADRGAAPSR